MTAENKKIWHEALYVKYKDVITLYEQWLNDMIKDMEYRLNDFSTENDMDKSMHVGARLRLATFIECDKKLKDLMMKGH